MPSNIKAFRIFIFVALCICPWIAGALSVDTPLPDSAQEARAKALFHEIRCVVCQSESVAESQAAIAGDMRRVIRERIAAGDSDKVIKQYLVSRYGDVILMRPPVKPSTSLLWFGPLLLLAVAAGSAALYFRHIKP